jgi:hypothetical protein
VRSFTDDTIVLPGFEWMKKLLFSIFNWLATASQVFLTFYDHFHFKSSIVLGSRANPLGHPPNM